MIWDALREGAGIVVALAVVSALAWGAVWLMKRFGLGGAGGPGAPWGSGGAPPDLRFVRALPVGPRERLVVVEWRGETLLLGVTAGAVSVLSREPGVAFPPAAPTLGENPS